MNKSIPAIYDSLLEIAWHFGNHGINGECCGDLSLVEFMALKKAYDNKELSIQEIGSALNFTKSGATRIIDRLENKGYVKRERSPLDGRVCCIPLTPKGIEVLTSISERYSTYIAEMLKELEPDTVENIRSVLELLTRSAQKHQNSLKAPID